MLFSFHVLQILIKKDQKTIDFYQSFLHIMVYMPLLRKFLFVVACIGILSWIKTTPSYAITAISDTITTSRPSAANVLSANQAANATQVSVIDLGQSGSNTIFLASDSAIFRPDTSAGESYNTINVASMSSQIAGSPNTRNIYFTSTISNAHHQGDVVTVPITAMHKVQFTTGTNIPVSGNLIITFPNLTTGDANNAASPSASTFQLNGIGSGQFKAFSGSTDITSHLTLTPTNPSGGGTAPTLSFALDGSTSITAGTVVTFYLGCSTATSASCSVNVPRIINPTKSFAASAGSADTWKIAVKTQDASSNDLESSSAKIATVESVQVQATVEPTITFTIAGFADNTNINTISGSCGSILTNSGIASTATSVNLGLLTNGQVNRSAQTLTVATNGSSGYVITATSSGQLRDAANGSNIQDANGGNGLTANDTPVPATITAGQAAFGIHACGARSSVNTDQWVNNGTITTAKFSNPWQTGTTNFYNTIASYNGGAVSSENTAVLYGATVSQTTPPGLYTTVLTYVATATF